VFSVHQNAENEHKEKLKK